MGLLAEFKAFLTKSNAIAIAIGIIVGMAFKDFVDGVIACFIKPLIDKVLPGDFGGGVTVWVFRVGDFLTIAVNFLVIMWVLFLLSKALLKEEKKA